MRILFILMLLPFSVFAQKQKEIKKVRDSVDYYQRLYDNEYSIAQHNMDDSLKNSRYYIKLQEKKKELHKVADDYAAFMIFSEYHHADYDKFNQSIQQNGFPKMNDYIIRLGFGFSGKFDQLIYDVSFYTFGLNNKSTKGDETIKATVSSLYQFDIGWDLIPSRKINLYPYAGLTLLRFAKIDYKNAAEINPNYTDITNYYTNNTSAKAHSAKPGYQLGLGVDVVLFENSSPRQDIPGGGIIFFAKGGTSSSFVKENYKIEGEKYKPEIRYGAWMITAGFKFFIRGME